MFNGFECHLIANDDVSINCIILGEGPPVLLHGFPQNLAMWAQVAPLLAEHFTVICADLRGYGDSGKPRCLSDRSNYAFRTMAEDNVHLMKTLGYNEFH